MPFVKPVVGRGSGARSQDLANLRQQVRLTTGHEYPGYAEGWCFAGDPPNTLEAECPAWRSRRGAHATVIAAQVAIEIRIKPQARSGRTPLVLIRGGGAAPKDPAGAAQLDGRSD